MKRLNRNQGGYFGETISIDAVLREMGRAAERYGWQTSRLPTCSGGELLALHRLALPTSRRVYLSTGTHGDEPAGPLAVQRLLMDDSWPRQLELWLCPCLNPTGFALNRRENREGIDLNRDYRHLESAEVRAQVAWLERQPRFDLALCLHEDWEADGFYVYELNPERQPSLGDAIVNAASAACPIDFGTVIEDRPAFNGIIRPELDPAQRPRWPEAFYLIQKKTYLSYTLEAPSDYPLSARVAALAAAVRAALQLFVAA
jgi:murein peptide amidase A